MGEKTWLSPTLTFAGGKKMAANNSSRVPQPKITPQECEDRLVLCLEVYRAALYNTHIAIAVVNSLLAVTAVLGNGLVFAAFYFSESLRRPAFTILMSVALTDFLTGAVSQPRHIYVLMKTMFSCPEYVCVVDWIGSFSEIFLFGATIMNLSVITIDRFIALFRTYQYEELVTNSRVIKLLLFLWATWGVVVACMAVFRLTIALVIGVFLLLNVIVICTLYFKILREVRRLNSNLVVPANEPQAAKTARETKAAVTTGYILGALFLCFLPMLITTLIAPRFMDGSITHKLRARKAFLISNSCYVANSSLNVLIYGWKNNEVRNAMRKVFRMIRQKLMNEVSPWGV